MEPIILDGKKYSLEIYEELRIRSANIIKSKGFTPILATIIVGDDFASQKYIKMKGKYCQLAGINSKVVTLPNNSTTDDVVKIIKELNDNSEVTGILLQHPLPKHVNEQECFNTISILKDVDGVNNLSFARNAMNLESFGCATPQGIMDLLDKYTINVEGKLVVIIGRSAILGKPLSMMMLNKNATVIICHSKTQNIKELTRQADILCVCIGKPQYVDETWLKEGVIVIDAGYNPSNLGDTNIEKIKEHAYAYTPVPGGVGPMTVATLIKQTIIAAEKIVIEKSA
jgi:methylenetetrahydrofolate dehydrogenase (NADP+)/methenyltetrahydrofolate cyclohydrolase